MPLNKAKTIPFGLSPSIFLYLNFVIKTKSENVIKKEKKETCPNPMNLYAKMRKSGEEERREKRVRDRQITSLIDGNDSLKSEEDRFASAEKVILRWDPSLEVSRRSLNWEDSGDEAD